MTRFRLDNATTDVSVGPFIAPLLIASLIHLSLILGVDLAFPKASSGMQARHPLEITVLQRGESSDEQSEITADSAPIAGMVGNGEETPETDDTTGIDPVPEIPGMDPLPALGEALSAPIPPPLPELAGPGTKIIGQPVDPVSSRNSRPALESEPQSILEPQSLKNPFPESDLPQVKAAEILTSRNLEIAELTARIQHGSTASANRPRRKAIGAGIREYKYANYLEAWCRKVERVGNLNYPKEAKRRKLYSSLALQVTLRADGSVERVRVLRSSGFNLLDAAAVKIVELAAPFSPFPPAIRAETDMLDITRTWQFLSSNRLGWKH